MEAKANLFDGLNATERFKALSEIAAATATEKVIRHYTPEEILQHKDFVTAEGIKLMDLEKEFKDISKEFNTNIKEFKAQIKNTLTDVKRGYSENEETVFFIDNQEGGMMDVYDVKGVFLYSRPLRPEEKQARIKDLPRTGTHD